MISFRKATEKDTDSIEKIYDDIHSCEEKGECITGWIRGVYPTKEVVISALERDDIFVLECDFKIIGSAIINKIQLDEYKYGEWIDNPHESQVMVLHTLVISPDKKGKGYGKEFVSFYEKYARENGCHYLRMDTNERNTSARGLYKKLGYREVGTVPCDFNGIKSVKMVLLEKILI